MGSRGIRDIPTIFHPQQTDASSTILGDTQQSLGSRNSTSQVTHDNSGCEQQGCSVTGGSGDTTQCRRPLETSGSGVTTEGTGCTQGHNTGQTQVQSHTITPPVTYQQRPNTLSACYTSCCAESAKKVH